MPNRSSIATGRLPSVHGTRFNGIPLDWNAQTFVRALREQGYYTAHVGKLHLQNIGDSVEAMQMATRHWRAGDAFRARTERYDYELQSRHREERVVLPEDFYGYQDVDLVVNHSDYCSGHYYQWLLDQGIDPAKLQGQANALPYDSPLPDQVWRTALPEELYPTRCVSLRAREALERAAKDPRPFFLHVSVPILDDPEARVRGFVLVEEDEMFDMLGLRSLRMRTLVTDEGRLTRYQGADHGELFALDHDPLELENLFSRSEGRELRHHLTERLATVLLEYADESPRPTAMA
jgi:hypothetical protein